MDKTHAHPCCVLPFLSAPCCCCCTILTYRHTGPPRFTFIEFAIIKSLQFPVLRVCVCAPGGEAEMGTGGHLIEATVLIVGFMRTPSVFSSLLNNLSPRQLLNQALSMLSCHKEARRQGCRAHTPARGLHAQTHMYSHAWIHTHTHTYSHTLIHTHVFKHVFTHVFTRTFTRIRAHTHTHTYTHIHNQIHTTFFLTHY